MTTPIIIFSDHPNSGSGLGRITRDLATRIHTHMGDEFRIATLGYGSPGTSKLPFPQFYWKEREDFLPLELMTVWDDFCRDDDGILLTIGDVQRFLPLADPKFSQSLAFKEWITPRRNHGSMKLWGYFPIDSHNRQGSLGPQMGHTLSHYDRILVPSEWAKGIVERTLPAAIVTVIPHGIDTSIFHPHPKHESQDQLGALMDPFIQWPKQELSVAEDALWIGIVATNQWRKDWGLGIEVVSEIAKTRPVFLWAHTDKVKHEWSLLELLSEFKLLGSSMLTMGAATDEMMAIAYSACDVTLGIGRGEGFGYPIAESLACGTPCVAGEYGAQIDYLPEAMIVTTRDYRIEGPMSLLRPIYSSEAWGRAVGLCSGGGDYPSFLPEDLDWLNVWPRFEKWIKEGLKNGQSHPGGAAKGAEVAEEGATDVEGEAGPLRAGNEVKSFGRALEERVR